MAYQDWSDIGDRIKNTIQDAVDSQDFRKLNQSVNETIRTMGDSIKHAAKSTFHGDSSPFPYGEQTPNTKPFPKSKKHLTISTRSFSVLGLVFTIVGTALTGAFSIACVALLANILFLQLHTQGSIFALTIIVPFLIAGIVLLTTGVRKLSKAKRFRLYLNALKSKTYCSISQLETLIGKSRRFIVKDVKHMIENGWFLEGHLDEAESCLIISHDTYEEYLNTKRYQEEESQRQQERANAEAAVPSDVLTIIQSGNAFLEKIRKSNDAIDGETISKKISYMEMLVQRIFDRVKEDPDVIPDLRKLMEYYLPTTIKLLDAYESLCDQPVQGANILSAKSEIEKTLDTLNIAFEKLLDSLFKDVAWDVSSDISVLHTMLAQEGLTKDDFK